MNSIKNKPMQVRRELLKAIRLSVHKLIAIIITQVARAPARYCGSVISMLQVLSISLQLELSLSYSGTIRLSPSICLRVA